MYSPSFFKVYNASAGSGKTYTLVKEYLRILLSHQNPRAFQSILCLTFTNKAAAEMKERVLTTLRNMASGKESAIAKDLEIELEVAPSVLNNRAKNILREIVENYSAFNIVTIDTFTYRLIRSFALELGLTTNFELELDQKIWLNEAVNDVISKVGENEEITKLILEYTLNQVEDDKSWNIAANLNDIGRISHNENHEPFLAHFETKSIQDFVAFKKKILQNQKIIEEEFRVIGEQALKIIDENGLDQGVFYMNILPKFFEQIKTDCQGISASKFTTVTNRIFNQTAVNKGAYQKMPGTIDAVLPTLENFFNRASVLYQQQNLNHLLLKSITPLAVLSEINKALQSVKKENNIQFLSEFNRLISKHLKEQPAAFIYEKIGEKFKYFFIDEMQDTSGMQWSNLIPLVENALAAGNSGLLLVGDAKQSIYRWRGGQPEQFIDLAGKDDEIQNFNSNPFGVQKSLHQLERNYRSFDEVIQFNNSFFTFLSAQFSNNLHQDLYEIGNKQLVNHFKGGYVQIDFLDEIENAQTRDEIIPVEIEKIIHDLQGEIDLNEICILVSKNKQAITISNYLNEVGIAVSSAESLLLKNNRKIDFIIEFLKYLNNTKDEHAKFNALYFLFDHWQIKTDKHTFFKELISLDGEEFYLKLKTYGLINSDFIGLNLSFYDKIEQIIRSFMLAKTSDAYLQFFLDQVLQFTNKHDHSITNFLEYWELKKDELSVVAPENKNAVNVMTIHKSKGLEFRIVIVPYDLQMRDRNDKKSTWLELESTSYSEDFDHFYVSYGSDLQQIGNKGKAIEALFREQEQLDNFNLAYVAYTRAIEQLYILCDKPKKETLVKSSDYLKLFLKRNHLWEDEKNTFHFGNKSLSIDVEKSSTEATVISSFISTPWQSHDITIAPSPDLFIDQQSEAQSYGNLFHEIMAKIISLEHVEPVLQNYLERGLINSSEKEKLSKVILEIVENEKLKSYFALGKIVFTERELLSGDKEILIPDRLIFDENEVTIIDYKTGKIDKKHHVQLEKYADCLNKIGFQVQNKILIYVQKELEVINF
ncbi:UvrD-helicase domain-containing protein [Namhaeicola litoreus]|uniref:DNA 3'-5' helicase n=1 Tax=Namhaeicola litoreus TaxID=1052145 RepID=A0ABW3Y0K5_9FLAO